MKGVKTIVSLSDINDVKVKCGKLMVFYTTNEPSKKFIKEMIEKKFGFKLEERTTAPSEGGDFGAFFYNNNLYITYSFEEIEIFEV